MLHAVIMAGGAGTRFWPESRALRPKQLLDFIGGRTMLQATADRLSPLVSPERVLVVTNQALVPAVRQQLPHLAEASVLGEPCKRDTAPCIGLAALAVLRHDAEATMAVVPSDHVIQPPEAFQQALALAARLVEQEPARLVTFGIRPTYPAESFGYIQRGWRLTGAGLGPGDPPVFRVEKFREKPKAELARQYLDSGEFYWNAGIFVWKARTILQALRQRQPEMVVHLEQIAARFGQADFPAVFAREFAAIQGISIDYAVMEHATQVLVIEAPFAWDDVGSWQALARLRGGDADGNTIAVGPGRHLGINTRGTIIRSSGDHLIATLGIQDCIIVHTPDATLVANKHDEEAIRALVKMLEERGWTDCL